MRRCGYVVTGQVQGVGFRPFVYRVAQRLGLTGCVGNTSRGVRVEVQGEEEAVRAFAMALRDELPPLAKIATLEEIDEALVDGETGFVIAESHGESGQAVLVSPDMGTCAACLEELFEAGNRRYLYPFINCTDCGPRLTITRSIPYDRATTSMACFSQCPACQAEYTDPGHRRFHAQPNACPVCGPMVWLCGSDGKRLEKEQVLKCAAQELATGAIVALKGLGGFQLVCNARDEAVLTRLRERKGRPHQSLAVMVRDVAAAQRVATTLSAAEEAELTSARRPIVAVTRKSDGEGGLPRLVAPDLAGLGLMLPYTPLHHVLLHLFCEASGRPDAALVMTSGNPRGEPLCLGNREALARLGDVADLFVLHDRDILVRADDSVVRFTTTGERRFVRRARGFVPEPVALAVGPCFSALPEKLSEKLPEVLAVGAELKNTACLTRGSDAFVTQHVGDMNHVAGLGFLQEAVAHMQRLLAVKPGLIVHDAHPDYQTTIWAAELAATHGVPLLSLQHHAAHIHSVLAEHGHSGPALGLALDGAGYGPDGTVWGGELLLVYPAGAGLPWPETFGGQVVPGGVRLGRLGLMPLPGGDVAAREPWRVACSLLQGTGWADKTQAMPWLSAVGGDVSEALHNAVAELAGKAMTPRTSSCGRLFDAVAAVLGLCSRMTYEGQGGIRLECCAQTGKDTTPLHTRVHTVKQPDGSCLWELDSQHLLAQVVARRLAGEPASGIALRFHAGLAQGLAQMAAQAAGVTGIGTVALSGGVMHNAVFSRLLDGALTARGLTPLSHRLVPPGDGGLSLGQAAWGKFWLQNEAERGIVSGLQHLL